MATAGAELDEGVSPRQQTSPMAQAIEPFGSMNTSLNSLDLRADPDAQATVTDFLDFTEYLPSDMTRSLTLIGKQDRTYADASLKVDKLTTTWGRLPTMAPEERPSPVQLRAEISSALNRTVSSRIYAHAESVRMAENVNRHFNRAKTILAKLQTMRDNYPTTEEQKSPAAPKSPQMVRPPKITLRVEGGSQRVRRQRVPRITVPGEVLAPYDLDYETYTDDSDESSSSSEDESLPRATPAPRIKLVKTLKGPKLKAAKIIKSLSGYPIAPPGMSTTTALAQLKPPPDDAVVGSADAPWLQLTPYELAKLRKRMKKNAQWTPSETMIARELKLLNRGIDSWKLAKKSAEEEGRPFENTLPVPIMDADGVAHPPLGALSIDAALAAEDRQNSNRGMKLNEAKKLKKETLAQLAAKEAEDSARRMAEQARAMFGPVDSPGPEPPKPPQPPPPPPPPKKRKREGGPEAEAEKPTATETPAQRQVKRTKTETPVPIPQPSLGASAGTTSPHETPVFPRPLAAGASTAKPRSTTPVPAPNPSQEHSIVAAPRSTSPSSSDSPPPDDSVAPSTVTTTVPVKSAAETLIPPLVLSPKKSTTPILPPVRETRTREAARKEQQKDSQAPPPPPPLPSKTPSRPGTPAAPEPARRPQSRGQAMSQEPQQSLAADRPRRASTARNTPAPESRQAGKRPKRPAPGVISRTNSGGSSAVGRRKAAPKKKRGAPKKDKAEADVEVEVDDEGNVIDPDEARYCHCNRVSFGTMIQCDNIDICKQEWFHLECVDLAEIPARTTKWYCPDCRVLLNIGERGEISARGVRM